MDDIKQFVKRFYTECLTVNDTADAGAVMGEILSDGFQSLGSMDSKDKQQMIGQV